MFWMCFLHAVTWFFQVFQTNGFTFIVIILSDHNVRWKELSWHPLINRWSHFSLMSYLLRLSARLILNGFAYLGSWNDGFNWRLIEIYGPHNHYLFLFDFIICCLLRTVNQCGVCWIQRNRILVRKKLLSFSSQLFNSLSSVSRMTIVQNRSDISTKTHLRLSISRFYLIFVLRSSLAYLVDRSVCLSSFHRPTVAFFRSFVWLAAVPSSFA